MFTSQNLRPIHSNTMFNNTSTYTSNFTNRNTITAPMMSYNRKEQTQHEISNTLFKSSSTQDNNSCNPSHNCACNSNPNFPFCCTNQMPPNSFEQNRAISSSSPSLTSMPTQSGQMSQNNVNTQPILATESILLGQERPAITVSVYNYFFCDFPKTFYLDRTTTVFDLKHMICTQSPPLCLSDIRALKSTAGKEISDSIIIAEKFKQPCSLNMEIFFNKGLRITAQSKNIIFAMLDTLDFIDGQLQFIRISSNNHQIRIRDDRIDFISSAVHELYQSEQGGKIIIGVGIDGIIEGVDIPDQTAFLRVLLFSIDPEDIYFAEQEGDRDISFFRVKDHGRRLGMNCNMKLVIIKIKGTKMKARYFPQTKQKSSSISNSLPLTVSNSRFNRSDEYDNNNNNNNIYRNNNNDNNNYNNNYTNMKSNHQQCQFMGQNDSNSEEEEEQNQYYYQQSFQQNVLNSTFSSNLVPIKQKKSGTIWVKVQKKVQISSESDTKTLNRIENVTIQEKYIDEKGDMNNKCNNEVGEVLNDDSSEFEPIDPRKRDEEVLKQENQNEEEEEEAKVVEQEVKEELTNTECLFIVDKVFVEKYSDRQNVSKDDNSDSKDDSQSETESENDEEFEESEYPFGIDSSKNVGVIGRNLIESVQLPFENRSCQEKSWNWKYYLFG